MADREYFEVESEFGSVTIQILDLGWLLVTYDSITRWVLGPRNWWAVPQKRNLLALFAYIFSHYLRVL